MPLEIPLLWEATILISSRFNLTSVKIAYIPFIASHIIVKKWVKLRAERKLLRIN